MGLVAGYIPMRGVLILFRRGWRGNVMEMGVFRERPVLILFRRGWRGNAGDL